ncbi:hypothetical protein FRB90_004691 [Tulasnella sp. 427]|nr:hypothetical protein FRB90_004691 [Tulasnella sp. 427]
MRVSLFAILASALLSAATALPFAQSNQVQSGDGAPQVHPFPHPHPNNFHHGPPEDDVVPYPAPHPDDVAREARALKKARGTNAMRLARGLPPLPPSKPRANGRFNAF